MPLEKKPLHILQLIPALDGGGAERTVLDISGALKREGHKPVVASAGGRLLRELDDQAIPHIRLPLKRTNPATLLANAFRLRLLIRAQAFDIVHAHSRAPAWSALWATKWARTPFITTYHGAYGQKSRLKAFYNSVMARSDRVIANSNWTCDLVSKRHPQAAGKIETIEPGIDFETFSPQSVTEARKEKICAEWDISRGNVSRDRFVILHLARLTSWKGQRTVLEAVPGIIDRHPHCRFVFAGDSQGRDKYRKSLERRIGELGIGEHVLLAGDCDDPAAALSVADLVLNPSTEPEAFGRSAVEAQALEKPVIVTHIGAVSETVAGGDRGGLGGRTGWKVPPGDAESLADAIEGALSIGREGLAQIGRRGRAFVLDRFSSRVTNKAHIDLYERMRRADEKFD